MHLGGATVEHFREKLPEWQAKWKKDFECIFLVGRSQQNGFGMVTNTGA